MKWRHLTWYDVITYLVEQALGYVINLNLCHSALKERKYRGVLHQPHSLFYRVEGMSYLVRPRINVIESRFRIIRCISLIYHPVPFVIYLQAFSVQCFAWNIVKLPVISWCLSSIIFPISRVEKAYNICWKNAFIPTNCLSGGKLLSYVTFAHSFSIFG